MKFEEKTEALIAKWESMTYIGGAKQKRYALKNRMIEALKEAILAERERCESIVMDGYDESCRCDRCDERKDLAERIRKGEVV